MFSQLILSKKFVKKISQTWKSNNNNNKDMYRTALHALAVKKWATGQSYICKEITSYRIGSLVVKSNFDPEYGQ